MVVRRADDREAARVGRMEFGIYVGEEGGGMEEGGEGEGIF